MAKTGQAGGRQSLELKREHGPIHESVPSVETSPQADDIRNASVRHAPITNNRQTSSINTPPPNVQKDFPESGAIKTPQGRPNTNRYDSEINRSI